MKKRLVLAAFFALTLVLSVNAQSPGQIVGGAAPTNEKNADPRRQTFDIVWRTVKDKHFDPALGGVNWDKVRELYEPRAAAAANDQALYSVLQQMLGELRQSHFSIVPPEAIIADDEKEAGGGVGVSLRLIDGAAVIVRIEPDSAAFRAGLRPGFVIEMVGEKRVEEIVSVAAKTNQSESLKRTFLARRILREVNGDPGTTVKLTALDGKSTRREVIIAREKLKGELSPRLGGFPPQYTEFESKRLDGNIGYIRFNIFTTPVIEKIRAAIRDLHDSKGLIFDLRGNPGGIGGIAVGIAGQLAEKAGFLGTMKMRTSELKFAVIPQQNPYTGPVVILQDEMSASTSEILAGGMQEMGRALVVGERSAGACLPSVFQRLPTGAIFQFAIADFKTPKGILVEGRGVVPDREVKWDRASLLAGRDAQLDAATGEIRRLQTKSKSVK